MRVGPVFFIIPIGLGLLALGIYASHATQTLSFASSAVLLESVSGFEAMAAGLTKRGTKACAPATIVGKSGVKHEFAFALMPDPGKARVVLDTELSVKDVDEMKVLKFYVKVFDVDTEKAILCVSPRLNERATALAKEYGIAVLEDEVPKKLLAMAEKTVSDMVGQGG